MTIPCHMPPRHPHRETACNWRHKSLTPSEQRRDPVAPHKVSGYGRTLTHVPKPSWLHLEIGDVPSAVETVISVRFWNYFGGQNEENDVWGVWRRVALYMGIDVSEEAWHPCATVHSVTSHATVILSVTCLAHLSQYNNYSFTRATIIQSNPVITTSV
jgi:hypothetical protein